AVGFPQKAAGEKRQKKADCRKKAEIYTKFLSLSGVMIILNDVWFQLERKGKRKKSFCLHLLFKIRLMLYLFFFLFT
ncbi:hypothetical protein UQ32_28455, partial [Escherichia coli]